MARAPGAEPGHGKRRIPAHGGCCPLPKEPPREWSGRSGMTAWRAAGDEERGPKPAARENMIAGPERDSAELPRRTNEPETRSAAEFTEVGDA